LKAARLSLKLLCLLSVWTPRALALEADPSGESFGPHRLQGLIGVFVLLGLAVLLSNNRRKIRWRLVLWGLALQLLFAVAILKTSPGKLVFDQARIAVVRILDFTHEGAQFLFGDFYVARPDLYRTLAPSLEEQNSPLRGSVAVFELVDADQDGLPDRDEAGQPVLSGPRPLGTILLFHVLPTIIFFSALMSLLYHLGLIQIVVRAFAWLMSRTMGTSGAESLSAAANIFVGQTEAPLVVRPYVSGMTLSELNAVMVGGFCTIAGGVLALYMAFLGDAYAGHLIAATVMAAPVGLAVAKILFPETESPETAGVVRAKLERRSSNVIDAIAIGALDGLKLTLNVAAMLLVFVAFMAMLNALLTALFDLKLADIFGFVLAPLAWTMGVPWRDAGTFGDLLGTKITINELVAYGKLMVMGPGELSHHSKVIATYALCGFANFASIGIQIGGIGAIAPERRKDLARLGLKAMAGGVIATCITASVAGMLY